MYKRYINSIIIIIIKGLMPLANGCKHEIVGQQLPTLLDVYVVSVYTSSFMLLRVVGSCCAKFETGQTSVFEKFLVFKREFLRKYLAYRAVKIFIDGIIIRKC